MLHPNPRNREGVIHAIKWATTRRYMSLETLGAVSDTALISLPGVGA